MIIQTPVRKGSIYYSDQLELIADKETLSISWFTDNIVVIQEWDAGEITHEFEVFLFGDQKSNEDLLLNLFNQVVLL